MKITIDYNGAFADIVEMARLYIITDCEGSFEKFSEWGLIRPKAQE